MAGVIGGRSGLRGHGELPLNADINVTSLVDVAFVLLIIFMITAPIMQGGVEVQLPKAEARPITAQDGMLVSVDAQGRIFIDETRVSLSDFRLTFRSLVQSRRPKAVYLRADRRVPYGEVVTVLAIIRASGISDVGLVAEEEQSP
jgi:biopolymer transport protein TolR